MPNDNRNLLAPFRRDKKNDFASGGDADLLRSKVLQAIMTRGATPNSSGEMPWRTAFGSGLELLRHQRNDHALAELARIYIRDTLRKWVPEVELVSVNPVSNEAALQIQVRFRRSGQTRAGDELNVNVDI
ncbi:MAG: hypothetical protein JXX14_06970 [Deltaproteobacteria bacterium]|nr:hypothetical protein [Deltaproteobacteria bacterium]